MLYFGLGEQASITFVDRKPKRDKKPTCLKDLCNDECNEEFQEKRKRLMDCHKFLNRKQRDEENLEQFRYALNELAANSDFGTQTIMLVYNIYVSKMNNTIVQEGQFT